MYPIDLRFAKLEKITIEEKGESKDITFLAYDEKAAEAYFKRIGCFSKQIEELKLEKPSDAVCWHISEVFADHPSFEELINAFDQDGKELVLYGIPVDIMHDEREFVFLELPEQKLVENTYWK